MRPTKYLARTLLLTCALTACADDDNNDAPTSPTLPPPVQVVSASGNVAATVAQFRTLLGEPRNGGAVGPSATGRREIGWDGVPAQFNNGNNLFPGDFFNTTTKLGLVMSTPGTGFRNDSTRFGDLDATLATEFAPFSPNKLFTVNGSRIIDVEFRLAGLDTPALVAGFGAVFVDVDVSGPTTLEYFDANGKPITKLIVQQRTADSPFSFAGARFESPIVSRVRIVLGQASIRAGVKDLSAGGKGDVVVLDDFLYTEPQPRP